MKEYNITVEEEYQNERIDKCISDTLCDLSRSYIQKMIKEGNVFCDGEIVSKASFKVNENSHIKLITPNAIIPDILPQDIKLDILYEDEDVIVVNKPKNMVVHPAPGHYDNTLVNALMYHCKDSLSGINGILRPGIVHRIDKNTTGSIIACKNDFAHESIALQLKNHTIKREYEAVVIGNLPDDEGVISTTIGRSQNDRKKMTVNVAGGKNAVTHYKVIKRFDKYTYVSCRLETGRTHQIRVHMSSIGHPILGDDIYGGCNISMPMKLDGHCLHAKILGFVHPVSNEYIETVAPLPEYFNHLLEIILK